MTNLQICLNFVQMPTFSQFQILFLYFFVATLLPTSFGYIPAPVHPNANSTSSQLLNHVQTHPNGKSGLWVIDSPGLPLTSNYTAMKMLTDFNRERIVERPVHAKGGGAHGFFEVTTQYFNIYTRANLFSSKGLKTPVFVRFSTSLSRAGTADTKRELRGFSVKFYTREGNWDLVGGNLPIFSVRDPLVLLSLAHASRPDPRNNFVNPNAIWGLIGRQPEMTLQILMSFGDLGYPENWRHMDGHGIHAFKLVNGNGETTTFVKFHWISQQGLRNMTPEVAMKIAGEDPDYFIHDLYKAIARQEYPKWDLYVQLMNLPMAKSYRYDPFDSTKMWLEEDCRMEKIGVLTLNRNPVDYFSEVEQSALNPGNLVPGIEMSPDPTLHARVALYLDSQHHRLGANFAQFPINAPIVQGGPNGYERDGARVSEEATEFKFNSNRIVGAADNYEFSQATYFLNKLDEGARKRLIRSLGFGLSFASMPEVRAKVLENFSKVDSKFGQEVKNMVDAIIKKNASG